MKFHYSMKLELITLSDSFYFYDLFFLIRNRNSLFPSSLSATVCLCLFKSKIEIAKFNCVNFIRRRNSGFTLQINADTCLTNTLISNKTKNLPNCAHSLDSIVLLRETGQNSSYYHRTDR